MALRPPIGFVRLVAFFNLATAAVRGGAIPFGNAATTNRVYIQTKKTAAERNSKNEQPLIGSDVGIADCMVHIDLDIIVGCGMSTLTVIPVDWLNPSSCRDDAKLGRGKNVLLNAKLALFYQLLKTKNCARKKAPANHNSRGLLF